MNAFKKIGIGVAALATALLGTTLAAQAQTTGQYTFTTTGLNSMDHHMAYTWNIAGIDLTGKTLTGATLSATNIYNWDNNSNRLWTHMLDTSRFSGVASFYDDNPNNSIVSDHTDDFVNTRYHSGKDARGKSAQWLVAPGTADTYLGYAELGTKKENITVNFADYGLLSTVDTYIRNGNNIAFGFDPDCHYYADKFTFTVHYKNSGGGGSNPVPEPGTAALLLAGLPLVGAVLRRRKAA